MDTLLVKCSADIHADLGDAADVMMSQKILIGIHLGPPTEYTLCDENRKTQHQYMKYSSVCVCVSACVFCMSLHLLI